MRSISGATVEDLADHLADLLADARADPFVEDIVVTPGPGLSRWLTQRLAGRLGGGDGDGVCARVSFMTMAGLAARCGRADQVWSAARLWPVLVDALADLPDDPALDPVRRHLGEAATRPRRRLDLAWDVARRFSLYAAWSPPLVAAWADHQLVDPAGHGLDSGQLWQPALWRQVVDRLGSPGGADPEVDLTSAAGLGHLAVFCPDEASPADRALLASVDRRHGLTVLELDRRRPSGLGAAGDRLMSPHLTGAQWPPGPDVSADQTKRPTSPSLLGRLQAGLIGRRQPAGPAKLDGSIRLKASHGLDRQWEVLRDLVLELMTDDPTLEPRDILVVTPQLEVLGPLAQASFVPDPDATARPWHHMRFQVSPSPTPSDPAVALVTGIVAATTGRASARDLFDLVWSPLVRAKFGLADTDIDLVTDVIESAGIRWGVNAAGRARYGLAGWPQNTWQAGLNRLVLGLALPASDHTRIGPVTPLDAAESRAPLVIEALSQVALVVARALHDWSEPTDGSGWVDRLSACAADLGAADAEPIRPALAGLTAFTSALTAMEVEAILRRGLGSAGGHLNLLNGSLTLTDLTRLRLVPHRVIIVIGLDAMTFPRPPLVDGDCLIRAPLDATPLDATALDQRAFADALLAARQTFAVIYAGFDPTTNAARPCPTPLLDVLSAVQTLTGQPADSVIEAQPAQPFSRTAQPLPTFDPAAARASQPSGRPGDQAAATTLAPVGSRPSRTRPGDPSPGSLELSELAGFFADPARAWLKAATGLSPAALAPARALPTAWPLTLDGLQTWAVAKRALDLSLAGVAPTTVIELELLGGQVAPGQLGQVAARAGLETARQVIGWVQERLNQPGQSWTIDLSAEAGLPGLSGSVTTRGGTIINLQAGAVRVRHQIETWVRLLALAVAYPDRPWSAMVVGRSQPAGTANQRPPAHVELLSPPAESAARELTRLRRLYLTGIRRPLPLPARASAVWAQRRQRGWPVVAATLEPDLLEDWSRDLAWRLIWSSQADLAAAVAAPWTDPADEVDAARSLSGGPTSLADLVYSGWLQAGGVV